MRGHAQVIETTTFLRGTHRAEEWMMMRRKPMSTDVDVNGRSGREGQGLELVREMLGGRIIFFRNRPSRNFMQLFFEVDFKLGF